MSRASRKMDHIRHALDIGQSRDHGFTDLHIVHNSLPNINSNDISIDTALGGLSLSSPLIINAMTGGAEQTSTINQSLAIVAREKGLAMAVGSQMSAIKKPEYAYTYKVVRKENPHGIVFANLGAEADVEQGKRAVDMLEANALQIHLNVIQELCMPEGDRDFQGALNRIEAIVSQLPVPVIVKEVGFGMSAEVVKRLEAVGVSIVDVGGYGGTNFASIENKRNGLPIEAFSKWGIKTVTSIVETKQATQLDVIASGGIQSSLEVIKSLALGAKAVGMAGYFLRLLEEEGQEFLMKQVDVIHEGLRAIMCALGCKHIEAFQYVPLVISGESYHWLTQRGFSPEVYARRQGNA